MNEIISKFEALDNGSSAIKIKADLQSLDAPAQIVKETMTAFGEYMDILVNNAGIDLTKSVLEITAEDFTNVYNLNVPAILVMCQAIIPHLGVAGRIINIASVAARFGLSGGSIYCSSKAAVEGLSRVLATELGSQGHTVNAVNPGPVQTDLLERFPKEIIDLLKGQTPVENRLGTTDDI